MDSVSFTMCRNYGTLARNDERGMCFYRRVIHRAMRVLRFISTKDGACLITILYGGLCGGRYIYQGGRGWLLDARLSNLCPLDNLSSRRLLPLSVCPCTNGGQTSPLIIPPLVCNTSDGKPPPIPPPLCLMLAMAVALTTPACV